MPLLVHSCPVFMLPTFPSWQSYIATLDFRNPFIWNQLLVLYRIGSHIHITSLTVCKRNSTIWICDIPFFVCLVNTSTKSYLLLQKGLLCSCICIQERIEIDEQNLHCFLPQGDNELFLCTFTQSHVGVLQCKSRVQLLKQPVKGL